MTTRASHYQLSGEGHRGTRAVQRLIEYAPASGGLALWMQHRDVEQPPVGARTRTRARPRARPQARPNASPKASPRVLARAGHGGSWVIGNDGSTLYYGPGFVDLPLQEQTGLVAHQVLHVALRHVARERALVARIGPVDSELYTACADAIVNAALSGLEWLSLPAGSIQLETLLQRVLGIDAPVDTSLLRWDTESLYRAIDDRRSQATTASRTSSARRDDENAARADALDEAGARQSDGPRAAVVRKLAASMLQDLVPDDAAPPEAELEQQRQWAERLTRAHAADGEQSLLRQLLADNRMAGTPWEQRLRTRLQRSLAQITEINWSRPSRSWLANRGRTAAGRRLPWEPGYSHARRCARLCVLIDVSGSVEDALLQRFANEIDRVLRTLRADVHLLIGDDRVRARHVLRPGVKPLRDIAFAGGGGTDFVPMLAAAGELRPDLAVFLTDLDGPAGEPVAWPLLWLVPAEASVQSVPFGQRIVLD